MHLHELPDAFLNDKDFIGVMKALRAVVVASRQAGTVAASIADIATAAGNVIPTVDAHLRKAERYGITAADPARWQWHLVGQTGVGATRPAKVTPGEQAVDVAGQLDAAWHGGDYTIRADLDIVEDLVAAVHRGRTVTELVAMLRPKRDRDRINNPAAYIKSQLIRLRKMDEDPGDIEAAGDG